jgi:glucose/mannose transport system permease protein
MEPSTQQGERGFAASPILSTIRKLWRLLLSAIRKHVPWFHGDTATAVLVLIPSIIAVAIFIYGFILWTGYVSLVKWDTVVEDYTFVGLQNWIQLFKMERFHWDLRSLALYAVGFMSQCIIFGFIVAVLLDQKIKGETIFRTIVIFPFAVSGVVTGVAWRWLMQPTTGINLLLNKIGFENFYFEWNANPKWGILAISIAAAWQFTGYVMALYLAALRGIPDELREAARVDGAGTWGLYRRIIIPLLRPVTFTAIVLTGMGSIRVFDLVTILRGPAFTTDTLAFHMYQSIFGLYRFSLAAAVGFFMIFLSLFLVVPYLHSMNLEAEQ